MPREGRIFKDPPELSKRYGRIMISSIRIYTRSTERDSRSVASHFTDLLQSRHSPTQTHNAFDRRRSYLAPPTKDVARLGRQMCQLLHFAYAFFFTHIRKPPRFGMTKFFLCIFEAVLRKRRLDPRLESFLRYFIITSHYFLPRKPRAIAPAEFIP